MQRCGRKQSGNKVVFRSFAHSGGEQIYMIYKQQRPGDISTDKGEAQMNPTPFQYFTHL